MHLDPFELHRPTTVDETIALAKSLGNRFDYLAGGTRPDAAWLSRQHALLDSASKPRAEMLLMIVDPIRKLVDATANRP